MMKREENQKSEKLFMEKNKSTEDFGFQVLLKIVKNEDIFMWKYHSDENQIFVCFPVGNNIYKWLLFNKDGIIGGPRTESSAWTSRVYCDYAEKEPVTYSFKTQDLSELFAELSRILER